ncbi:hypothetical protein ACRAVF_27190 [Bradyrhizobium oligotrophicum S58]
MANHWRTKTNPSLYGVLRAGGHSPIEAAWNVIRRRFGGKAYWHPRRVRRELRLQRERDARERQRAFDEVLRQAEPIAADRIKDVFRG